MEALKTFAEVENGRDLFNWLKAPTQYILISVAKKSIWTKEIEFFSALFLKNTSLNLFFLILINKKNITEFSKFSYSLDTFFCLKTGIQYSSKE